VNFFHDITERKQAERAKGIWLSRENDSLSLEIQDDGKGIPAQKLAEIQTRRAGVGITGMRERVRHLRGQMNVESNNRGTKISVAFPLLTDAALEPENTLSRAGTAGNCVDEGQGC